VSQPDEILEGELLDGPSVASLEVMGSPDLLIRPAASMVDIEAAFSDYQRLCNRLLNDDDVQHIGGRSFRKKSAWRKLAVAFGVSCEVRERTYDRDEDGAVTRAEVLVRATAPNGRFMDGLGVCDISERKFSKPQHDIPATAMTRATNRACADLFGMGEVSAEEITDDGTARERQTGVRVRDLQRSLWQTLGYESDSELQECMETLIDTAKALTEKSRDEFKAQRKSAGIEWPVPKKDLDKVWAMVSLLADSDNAEPF